MEAEAIFLSEGPIIDSGHPAIIKYAREVVGESRTPLEKAIMLYYAVRDGWQYVATRISFKEDELKASHIMTRTSGHCIEKAVLMVAFCRAVGVPARLCMAKVKNHIAAEKVEEIFGTGVLVPHGYLEVFLEGKWVKATPAFNKSLCEKLGVGVLEFDGRDDSLFQPYSDDGRTFMEYLEDYGHYKDVPLDEIIALMRSHYPAVLEMGYKIERGVVLELK